MQICRNAMTALPTTCTLKSQRPARFVWLLGGWTTRKGSCESQWIYGCFQKLGYLQIIHFNRVFHYKPSILGYPYFWKHPYTIILSKNNLKYQPPLSLAQMVPSFVWYENPLLDRSLMIFTEMDNWSFVKHNSSLHPWVKLRVIIQTCWTPAQPQTLQQMSQPQRRSSTWGGASCLSCTRCTPQMREALCWWLLMVLGIWNIYQKWIN